MTNRNVRPIFSLTKEEAHRRVLNLYKAWHRQLPYIVAKYDIPKSVVQCREKLRENFYLNKDVKDIRVIDRLVAVGDRDLKEIVEIWKQKHHVMAYWKESTKPKGFLCKFFSGHED